MIKKNNSYIKSFFERLNLKGLLANLSTKNIIYYCIITLSVAILFTLYFFAITPEKYDIKPGQISPKTIVAPKMVVDILTTEKERQAAANLVEPVYIENSDIDDIVFKDFYALFEQVESVQKYGESLKNTAENKNKEFTPEEFEFAKGMLNNPMFDTVQIEAIFNLSSEHLLSLKNNMLSVLQNTLKANIRQGNENESIQYMLMLVAYQTDINTLQYIVEPIYKSVVKPNLIIDEEATNIAKENAKAAVEDVVFQKGQNIVLEGNRIYPYQYQLIKDLGLLRTGKFNAQIYFVLIVFISLLILSFINILRIISPEILQNNVSFAFVMIAVISTSICCIIARYLNVYFAPVLLATFLTACLIGTRPAIATTIFSILLNVLLLYGALEAYDTEIPQLIIANIISGIAVISILRKSQKRQNILVAGTVAGFMHFIVILFFAIYGNANIKNSMVNAFVHLLSAYIAALLAMGAQPVFEYIFNMCSENKLLELSNPDHPLLKRVLLKAPGTYQHSMMVANLSEAAAEVIGANSLLVRVGAYYHDVGKTVHPEFFKENQSGENIHNTMDSFESAEIVIQHVDQGVKLAKQYRLPKQIREFITTHHGNSVVMYFYHEAKKTNPDKEIDINQFRYKHSKAKTKEQSIVMLADTVEAAVRTLKNKNPEIMLEFIHTLIDAKMQDKQLSESALTMHEIELVCESFVHTLEATYHERIVYPQIKLEEDNETTI